MAKGTALVIGVNSVDSQQYGGWSGELKAPESDAKNMTLLANSQGFNVRTLLTKEATYDIIREQLEKAASLEAGDFFIIFFSGFGAKLPDRNNDEDDYFERTWCLYDRQFTDDELFYYLSKFNEGVRVLVLEDSCSSGTIMKGMALERDPIDQFNSNISDKGIRYKFIPDIALNKAYNNNKNLYDKILGDKNLIEEGNKMKAAVTIISSCSKNHYAQDGEINSLFTLTLLNVWNKGSFKGSYEKFYKTICKQMPESQKPIQTMKGKNNDIFVKQKPFTI